MAFDVISYALSRKYVSDTADSLGSLKGAPATVKSVVLSPDGKYNTVTFEWAGTSGAKQTQEMRVYNGTPILDWTAGTEYEVGTYTIYETALYRCVTANNDSRFDESKWMAVGAADGNYSIVESSSALPTGYGSQDRKLYYSIEDGTFWLWTGSEWAQQQPKSITKQQIDNLFKV